MPARSSRIFSSIVGVLCRLGRAPRVSSSDSCFQIGRVCNVRPADAAPHRGSWSKIARMKLANIFYRGRDFVVTELAPGELVGIASLPSQPAAQNAPVDMLDIIRGGEPLRQALLASLDEDSQRRFRRADSGGRRALVSARAPPREDLRGRDEQLVEQRAQDQRAGSSGVLLEAGLMPRRAPRADSHSPVLRQRAPRARARGRHRPRDARRAGYERARRRVRLHDLQRRHGQRHARRGSVSLLGRLREEGRPEPKRNASSSICRTPGATKAPTRSARWDRGSSRRTRSRTPTTSTCNCKVGGELVAVGQHALLQLQGRRGRELHQPVPYAASRRRGLARHGVQAGRRPASRSITRTFRRWRAPSKCRSTALAPRKIPSSSSRRSSAHGGCLERPRAPADPRRARRSEHGVLLSPRSRRRRCAARALRRRRLLHARQPRVARQSRARAGVFRSRSATTKRTARHLYSGLKLDIESATRARGTSVCLTFGAVRRAAAVARDPDARRRLRRRLRARRRRSMAFQGAAHPPHLRSSRQPRPDWREALSDEP